MWPDPFAPYDYPDRSPANVVRWKEAVACALTDESLRLTPSGGDVYDLSGSCPRCGHRISQVVEFDVIMGSFPGAPRFGVFTVRCNCPDSHDGRDGERKGCGWGGPLPVPLHVR